MREGGEGRGVRLQRITFCGTLLNNLEPEAQSCFEGDAVFLPFPRENTLLWQRRYVAMKAGATTDLE